MAGEKLTPSERAFIHNIHTSGVYVEGEASYKINDRFPSLRLAPDKMQLRQGAHITPKQYQGICDSFGFVVADKLRRVGVDFSKIDGIVGVPDAGNNLAKALAVHTARYRPESMPVFELKKAALDNPVSNELSAEAQPGQRVIVVDDLISTAESVLKTIIALQRNQLVVVRVAAAFDRELLGVERLEANGFDVTTLMKISQFYDYSVQKKLILPETRIAALAFIKDAQELLRTDPEFATLDRR